MSSAKTSYYFFILYLLNLLYFMLYNRIYSKDTSQDPFVYARIAVFLLMHIGYVCGMNMQDNPSSSEQSSEATDLNSKLEEVVTLYNFLSDQRYVINRLTTLAKGSSNSLTLRVIDFDRELENNPDAMLTLGALAQFCNAIVDNGESIRDNLGNVAALLYPQIYKMDNENSKKDT